MIITGGGSSFPKKAGHGEVCIVCGNVCEEFAADPAKWPVVVALPYSGGKISWACMGCVGNSVMNAMDRKSIQDELSINVQKMVNRKFQVSPQPATETTLDDIEYAVDSIGESLATVISALHQKGILTDENVKYILGGSVQDK